MDDPLEFASDLARQAGQFLLGQYRSGGWQAELKSDRSVVTTADLESDRQITAAIRERYPLDGLLTEELHPDSWHTAGGSAIWVIDPLDGTTNFSLGVPFWGVLIARLVSGAPEIAAAYFPAIDELYTARRSEGAWLNGRRLEIAPPGVKSPLSFFACCSRTHRRYQINVPYKTRILGCAAYTLCAVARSVAIVGFESVARLWDLAAPWLILSEAGGVTAVMDGDPPFPLAAGSDMAGRSYSVLAAASPELLSQLREQIVPRRVV
jgi:myo-inositol-1(or 4)-monophosphatase